MLIKTEYTTVNFKFKNVSTTVFFSISQISQFHVYNSYLQVEIFIARNFCYYIKKLLIIEYTKNDYKNK